MVNPPLVPFGLDSVTTVWSLLPSMVKAIGSDALVDPSLAVTVKTSLTTWSWVRPSVAGLALSRV